MKIHNNGFMRLPVIAASPLIFVLFIFFSCTGSSGENGSAMNAGKHQPLQNLSLAVVKSAPQDFENRVVTIAGVFKGWKGMCRSSFTITRSDWILEDGTDCIYVSGQMPAGVSASKPGNERLTVTGTVMRNKAGDLHLKAAEIR